jgi:hypothetical protein
VMRRGFGEDRRTVDQTCAILLAVAGRERWQLTKSGEQRAGERRSLRKSAVEGRERGFGPAITIQSAGRRQAVACARIKAHNPCATGRIGPISSLTHNVRTEIPVKETRA